MLHHCEDRGLIDARFDSCEKGGKAFPVRKYRKMHFRLFSWDRQTEDALTEAVDERINCRRAAKWRIVWIT